MCLRTREDFPAFFTFRQYKAGVEVGVLRGDYAECLSKGWNGKLYLVDAWKHLENYKDVSNGDDITHEANYQFVKQRFAGNPNVVIMRNLSIEAAARFHTGSLDWVYLDANHSYEAVKADLEAWYPKVRIGGIIAGHDYIDAPNHVAGNFGVRSAVREFFAGGNIHEYPDWWVIKP
jgi:hypothetical protein